MSNAVALHYAILDTLAFFAGKKVALSAAELHQHLHRLPAEEEEVRALLKKNPAGIASDSEFFCLEKKFLPAGALPEELFEKRRRAAEILPRKWKILRERLEILRKLPFLRGIAASGSLAAGWPEEDSDLDLFLLVEPGKLWLARGFFVLEARRRGWLRQEKKRETRDRLCPNHFLAAGAALGPQNFFTAHLYGNFIWVAEGREEQPKKNPSLFEDSEFIEEEEARWRFLSKESADSFRFPEEGSEEPAPAFVNRPPTSNPQNPVPSWISSFLPNLPTERTPPFLPAEFSPPRWEKLLPPGAELIAKLAQRVLIYFSAPEGKRKNLHFSREELAFHGEPQEPYLLAEFEKIRKFSC